MSRSFDVVGWWMILQYNAYPPTLFCCNAQFRARAEREREEEVIEEEEGHAAQNHNSHGQEQAPGSTSKSPFECAADQFQCHDYVCIVGYKRCNGFKDCEDGSDELYCDYGDEGISSSLIIILPFLFILSHWLAFTSSPAAPLHAYQHIH